MRRLHKLILIASAAAVAAVYTSAAFAESAAERAVKAGVLLQRDADEAIERAKLVEV